jgi:type II secretory pathway pseudopilin PulG
MSEPTTSKRKKKRGPRGWLLVEVAVGGVMASVILGSLLIHIGDSMDRSTVVGRKLTAQMLAQQGIEQARAVDAPLVNLLDGTADMGVPPNLVGSYTRTRTITSGETAVGALTLRFKDVTVTVTFPQRSGVKTVSVQTRIYSGT